jgi:mono/diheme cytochrome c family protein
MRRLLVLAGLAAVAASSPATTRRGLAQDVAPVATTSFLCDLPPGATAPVESTSFPPFAGPHYLRGSRRRDPAKVAALEKLLTSAFGTPADPKVPDGVPLDAEKAFKLGRTVYRARCAACHGAFGDGSGPSARDGTDPLDFRVGSFKFVSAPQHLGTNADELLGTVRRWIPRERWPGDAEVRAALEWVRFLAFRGGVEAAIVGNEDEDDIDAGGLRELLDAWASKWSEAAAAPPFAVPKPIPPSTGESVARGRKLFHDEVDRALCHKCHSPEARAELRKDATLIDEYGHPWRDRDLDLGAGRFKWSRSPDDIYARICCGCGVMPAFRALNHEELCDLVPYCESVEGKNP